MKKILFYGALALLLFASACGPAEATPTEVQSEEPPSPPETPTCSYIPGTNANCRIGPSTLYPILAVLTPGAEYQVLGINEDASWLFINTSLTQCWVKLTTGQACAEVGTLPFVAYGPVPESNPEMAEGTGGTGDSSGSGGSGGAGGSGGSGPVVLDPGLFFVQPYLVVAFCGSYTTEPDCTSHGCTWVPPQWDLCGNPPLPCSYIPGYCTN